MRDEDKYTKLRQQLEDGFEWPTVYLFKFIVPAENELIAKVEALFDSHQAEVTMRQSSNGNFASISAKEMMINPEKVIERYRAAESIKGLIAL